MNTNTTSKTATNTMNEQNERSTIMKVIEMTKKGVGTVKFTQTGTGQYLFDNGVTEIDLKTADELNRVYLCYKAKKWTVKPEEEAKPEKDVKAPKQSTPRLQWNKEGKKAWAIEFNRRKTEALKSIMSLKGKEYHEARINLEKQLKAEMKVWEAENAERINEEIDHRRAEAVAIGG